ncbi:MFS transporter [Stutzerimonas xanthomarina]|uniref:MFS transporter n=1 Tax=Stutzerimonas xanthomarina TaxID=271420 RepID=A0A427EAH9_9GAMM|nr:MFS transporter [Stutzerimonas xanthomarina]RRV13419.1 MFS transporter [Stutzerimonas xanthomarina]
MTDVQDRATLSLPPLLFANMACTMAVVSFVSLAAPIARLLGLQPWQAGFAVTLGGILWMLLARLWGAMADRHGRRHTLLLGAGGVTLAYWSMCAVIILSLKLLPAALWAFLGIVITRGAVGAFYSAIPTAAQALIADHYSPDERAASLAALGAAGAVGMVAGPALAGLLAQSSLTLPLYVTALLPAVGFVTLWFSLPRHERPRRRVEASLSLVDPRLRRPMAVCLIVVTAIGAAQMTVGFFALDRLGLEPVAAARAASLALTLTGIAMILAQLLVRRLAWTAQQLIRAGGMVSAVGFTGAALSTTVPVLAISFFVSALGMGWLFPAFATLATNAVEPHEQGGAAGSIGVMQGLGIVIGPLAGTLLHGVGATVTYWVLAVLLAGTALWPVGQRSVSPLAD